MREITVGLALHGKPFVPWQVALEIAAGCGAHLKVVLVNDSINHEALMFASGEVVAELMGRVRDAWEVGADDVEQRLREEGRRRHVKVAVLRHEGRFVGTLLEAGKHAWLTVVGRGEHSDQHPGTLGDRVEILTRRCRSALLVTPTRSERPQRVVAAYAGKALGERVLDLGTELAQALATPLVVLTIGDDLGRRQEILDRARERLSDPGVQAEFVGESGRAETVIPSWVSSRDLLVLGPHGRTPLYRMLLGRVTDRVIRSFSGPMALAARDA